MQLQQLINKLQPINKFSYKNLKKWAFSLFRTNGVKIFLNEIF